MRLVVWWLGAALEAATELGGGCQSPTLTVSPKPARDNKQVRRPPGTYRGLGITWHSWQKNDMKINSTGFKYKIIIQKGNNKQRTTSIILNKNDKY